MTERSMFSGGLNVPDVKRESDMISITVPTASPANSGAMIINQMNQASAPHHHQLQQHQQPQHHQHQQQQHQQPQQQQQHTIQVKTENRLNGFGGDDDGWTAGHDQQCCLFENGRRCLRVAGNASYNKRIQKTVAQKKLKLSMDNSVSEKLQNMTEKATSR
jgi:hypothetical protein